MESEDDPSGHCGYAGWQSATLTYERLHPAEHHDLEMLPASGWIMQLHPSRMNFPTEQLPGQLECHE